MARGCWAVVWVNLITQCLQRRASDWGHSTGLNGFEPHWTQVKLWDEIFLDMMAWFHPNPSNSVGPENAQIIEYFTGEFLWLLLIVVIDFALTLRSLGPTYCCKMAFVAFLCKSIINHMNREETLQCKSAHTSCLFFSVYWYYSIHKSSSADNFNLFQLVSHPDGWEKYW